MTDEERTLITSFVTRTVNAGGEAIDPEADALLKELFEKHPEARYRLTQLAFFQEHALAEATNRANQVEWQAQSQPKGLLGGLFGGGNTAPPPAQVHAPGYRPGMFQQGRPGFLGTAASTAVGVLGGIMLGNALASMMGMGGAAEAAEPEPAAIEDDGGFDGDDDLL
ncbi:DUF2076 family protein [Elioraea sp.]|uniref:DUF2076 domain-containing protein n=1 Tax=Elioraea sp. TaxID=2185103 RepID=UPI0025C5F7E1|nr:DUF2076 family protein [Elioraea sp.]